VVGDAWAVGVTSGQPPVEGSFVLNAPANAAAMSAGAMGRMGGVAFLSPSMVSKRHSRKQGVVRLVGWVQDCQHSGRRFCTASMTRVSTQDWLTVRLVSARRHQQLLPWKRRRRGRGG
jgi:hypothetical protein